MLGICFSSPQDLMQREYWSYVFEQFNVDNVWERGRSSDVNSNYKLETIEEYSELPNVPLIILAHKNAKYIRGEVSLLDFKHPENCIYVFGSDNGNIYPEEFGGRDLTPVYIPPSNIEMYSFQAAAIVMYDRMVEHG